MARVSKAAPCSSCAEKVPCRTTMVRVYRSRWQVELRFNLCDPCELLLEAMLEANAVVWHRNRLWHGDEFAVTPAFVNTNEPAV